MAQAAIKVGQAFIPIEVDFTGVNKKVAKSVAKTMNYASKSATLPIRHTMFAGAAPALTRALTRTNFAADALFKGKFSNRLNKGLSQSFATAMSRTSVPINAGMFSGFASAFQRGFKGGSIEPSSLFKGGLGGFGNFGRAAYSAFIASFTVGTALTARTAIKSYGEYERAQLGLTSMLKSAEKANGLMKEIQDFAVVSPFNMQNLLDAAKQMTAFRFESKDIIPIMRDIGDAAAALGTGDEGIQRMIRAMGQIKVKGRVMAEELMQLNEIGIAGADFVAEHLGVSTREALDKVHKGEVDAATGIEALRKGMQKYFGGSMKVQEGTLFGLWSNLKDQFEIAARLLFAPVSEDTKGLLRGTIEKLESIRKWAETEWPGIVQKFRDDPKTATKEMVQRLWQTLTQQDWGGMFARLRGVFRAGFDLAKEVPWGEMWRDFRAKAWDAYLYVKHLDWPGIWNNVESAGSKLAASLKAYDWKGLGVTIKGEVMDAWETGKSIAGYLKEKFEAVDWDSMGGSIADKLGAARQKMVDKVQGVVDEQLAKITANFKIENPEQAGRVVGETIGTNIRDAIRWTIETGLDIGTWIAEKLGATDFEGLLKTTGEFGSGLGMGLVTSLFNIDEETLKAKMRELFNRIEELSKTNDLNASVDLQLGAATITTETLESVDGASKTLGERFTEGVDLVNRILDPQEAALAGERAGNMLNHAFATAAASIGSFGDWLWNPKDEDTIVGKVDSMWERVKQASITYFGGIVTQSMGGLLEFVGASLYAMFGGIWRALKELLDKFLYEWDKYVNVPLNQAIEAFNSISPVKLKKLPAVSKQYDELKKPKDEFVGAYWEEVKKWLTPPTVEEHQQKYAERHGYNRWEDVPKVKEKVPSSWHGWGQTEVERPAIGKSAKVEVHQHFDGRYIEPEEAKRAAKLGIRAGT